MVFRRGLPGPNLLQFCPLCEPRFPRHCFQSRIGQFNDDTTDILVVEEVVARELHVIEITLCVEKERIAAPTEEQTVGAGFRNQRFLPD